MKIPGRTIAILAVILLCKVAQAQTSTEWVYVKLEVDGLSCPFCAYGLEKKLKKIPGAEDIYISIKEGFATLKIQRQEKPAEDVLIQVVKEAGFTPRAVVFSEKAFNAIP